ncbi:MAG: branched-chain amino acid ABC transporter permease [Chloroflexi bacterium]|nr:branched-chain amino acid ABC transporter permease [Chloroflexota bacterium]
MDTVLLAIGFGLVTASILAIAGMGLSLQFGVTNYVNFAAGDYATLGAYVALILDRQGVSIWLSLLAAGAFVAVFAVAMNRLIFKRLIEGRYQLLILFVVTLGVSIALQNSLQAIFGAGFQVYSVENEAPITIGPFLLGLQQLTIIGIAVLCMTGVHVVLRYTQLGKAMRAMSDSRDLAEASGIDTVRVTDVTWLITGFLTGVSGVVLALNVATFTPTIGAQFLLLVFATVILGGIGRPYGAMLGALVLGVTTEVAAAWIPTAYVFAMAFLLMIVLLFLRPQGLLPARGKA